MDAYSYYERTRVHLDDDVSLLRPLNNNQNCQPILKNTGICTVKCITTTHNQPSQSELTLIATTEDHLFPNWPL